MGTKNYPNIIRFRTKSFDDRTGDYAKNKSYEMIELSHKLNKYWNVVENLEDIFLLGVTHWQGIIRREFVLDSGLEFNNLRCCNDRSFFITSILKLDEVYVSDVMGVNHRVNNSSSLVGIRAKNFNCHYKSVLIIKNFCEKILLNLHLFQKFCYTK